MWVSHRTPHSREALTATILTRRLSRRAVCTHRSACRLAVRSAAFTTGPTSTTVLRPELPGSDTVPLELEAPGTVD